MQVVASDADVVGSASPRESSLAEGTGGGERGSGGWLSVCERGGGGFVGR